MRLLLDSHILVAIAFKRLPEVSAGADRLLRRPDIEAWVSVASLWEIAIKTRLGKLDPGLPLEDLPRYFGAIGFTVLPITAEHALATVEPLPATRDPFDRLLLAQCSVEGLWLVTLDEALRDHPLAARLV
ncbi:MAG: type II toxin-antitoxin system VapC family toxin [Methylorubrum rhodinum]|uniref:type II toxin-antitoxin system VapC family toxin n=1 Tax=Methylorubrum rhodinum TaxID=29428 RepID=UPI003BAE7A9C